MMVSFCREDIAEVTGGVSPCGCTLGSFNYDLVLGLVLFIHISHLLLLLCPFPSCFPSCLLSGVLQPPSFTGEEPCLCWCGSLLQPGAGCEPQIHDHCTFLCIGFVVSLVSVLCHPFPYPFYHVFPSAGGR